MRLSCNQHFFPLVLLTATLTDAKGRPDINFIDKITSQRFELAYQLDSESGSATAIQLWYTLDEGRTWRNYGLDPDAKSPVMFNATSQGLYGFFIVASNPAGKSGGDPGSATVPHYWAFVDYTPPVVELHAIRQNEPPTKPPVVLIRWSATDNALTSRPIELLSRTGSEGPWKTIARSLANSGFFEWHVEDPPTDPVIIGIRAQDRAGHVVQVTAEPFTIRTGENSGSVSTLVRSEADKWVESPPQISQRVKTRANRSYRQGVLHSLRGEYRLAAARLKDALSADPSFTDALVELAKVLYAQGQMDQSVEAYQLALRQAPQSRDALEGLALSYIGDRRFNKASEQLERIVRMNPKDVEAWLNLGDVSIYKGDELKALQHYRNAATLNPASLDTIEKARLRLAGLKQLAGEYRQPATSP